MRDYLSIAFCAMAISTYYGHARIVRDRECGLRSGVFSVVYRGRTYRGGISTVSPIKTSQTCIGECLENDKCSAIDYHNSTQTCKLLPKTIGELDIQLKEEEGWMHYETDINEVNSGPMCSALKPCGDGTCVDQCKPPGYNCTCEGEEFIEGTCQIRGKSPCLQIDGNYIEKGEISSTRQRLFINVTRYESEPDNEQKFQVNVSSGVQAIGQFDENSCSRATASYANLVIYYEIDYRTCILLSSMGQVFVFEKKDCGYKICQGLVGKYDKGEILLSNYGSKDGLRIARTDREKRQLLSGFLYQVESHDPTKRCLGTIPGIMKLVSHDECHVVWKKVDSSEIKWRKAECGSIPTQ